MPKVRKLSREEQQAEDDRQTFSKMRRTLGVRQAELSKATGIDQSRLSRWENGRTEITHEEIVKIAMTLDAALAERSEKGIPFSLKGIGYLEPSTSSKNLGKSYAEWRRKNGVTQQEVANYINTETDGSMSVSSISAFENGYCSLDKHDYDNLSHALIQLVNKKRAAAGFQAVEFDLSATPKTFVYDSRSLLNPGMSLQRLSSMSPEEYQESCRHMEGTYGARWRETFAEMRESGKEIGKLEREKAIQARLIDALRGEVAAQAEQIAALRDLLDLKTKEVVLRDKIESASGDPLEQRETAPKEGGD